MPGARARGSARPRPAAEIHMTYGLQVHGDSKQFSYIIKNGLQVHGDSKQFSYIIKNGLQVHGDSKQFSYSMRLESILY